MKDLIRLVNRLLGGTYNVVNTNNRSREDNVIEEIDECYIQKRSSERNWTITFVVLGMMSILTGILTYVINPYDVIYRYKIKFSEGGEIFELWRNPPVDLYLRVFLWNITNSAEFISGQDEKLKVQEIGPYVYKELMSHKNVTFNSNGTLSTIPSHPLVFVPELSEGRLENDSLILPNIALLISDSNLLPQDDNFSKSSNEIYDIAELHLSIAHVVSDESYFTRLGLNMLIRQTDQQPLVKMSAREFMFDYTNSLMSLGNKFMPNWISFKTLGLIDRMYDFDGDFETVYTGEDDIRKAGLIDMWRGSTSIPQWKNPCGNVRGASDGTKFPIYIKPEDKLFFYRKSMCRAKHLIKINETIAAGFKTYVYNFEDDWEEQNKTKCFCNNLDMCFPRGLLDVHGCYYGFPIALSSPHFYNDDPIIKAKVEGLYPDPEKHESFFVIEPQSGTPIELRANFQINMALRNIKTIAHVEKFSDMVMPLLWAEFRLYGLPDSLRNKLVLYLKILPVVTDGLMYGSFFGGILILLYSVYRLTQLKSNRKRTHSVWMQERPTSFSSKASNYNSKMECTNMMDAKELETYYHSVIMPLNNELEGRECSDIRRGSASA